jgi:sn-glycerol 3-phosphate transport system substrate-binding protein
MKRPSLTLLLSGAIAAATLAGVSAGAGAVTSVRASTPTCASSLATSSKSPIDITFWEGMPEGVTAQLLGQQTVSGNYASIDALVKAFNKAENGKIVVTDVNQSGGYGQTWSNYTASLSNHTSPNVMMFDEYDAQAALDTQSILPMSTCLSANKFSTKPFSTKELGAFTAGKTLIGMPYSASVPIMYYNQQAFTQAGIKSPPTTMAQLITDQGLLQKTSWTCAKCNNNKGTSGKYTNGVSIKNDPWEITSWLGLANADVVNNSNGHTKRATAASFGSNTTLKSYLADMQTIAKNANGHNVYDVSASDINDEYGNLFDVGNGVSGITFDTTAALGEIDGLLGIYPNVTMGVAPLPTLTGTSTGSMPSGGNGLFINSSNSSAAQEAASWLFIQYLTSATNLATWDAESGYLPIRSDELTTWKTKLAKESKSFGQPNLASWFETGYSSLSTGPTNAATEGPLIGAYTSVNNDMSAALGLLLKSPFSDTPSQALSVAATNATADIKSYNNGL